MTAPARHADCQLCEDIRRVITKIDDSPFVGLVGVMLTRAEADTLLEVLRPLVETGENAPAAPDYTGGGSYEHIGASRLYGYSLCSVQGCIGTPVYRRLDGPRGTDGRERPLYLCEEHGPQEAKP